VASTVRTPHVEVTRRFELDPSRPFLKVSYTVSGRGEAADLAGPQFPHVRFSERFLSVIEGDERDLFFDGAELGRGRQLPCWRVFFLPGHRTGLLVAARSKLMMSHIQIWPRIEKGRRVSPAPDVLVQLRLQHVQPAPPRCSREDI